MIHEVSEEFTIKNINIPFYIIVLCKRSPGSVSLKERFSGANLHFKKQNLVERLNTGMKTTKEMRGLLYRSSCYPNFTICRGTRRPRLAKVLSLLQEKSKILAKTAAKAASASSKKVKRNAIQCPSTPIEDEELSPIDRLLADGETPGPDVILRGRNGTPALKCVEQRLGDGSYHRGIVAAEDISRGRIVAYANGTVVEAMKPPLKRSSQYCGLIRKPKGDTPGKYLIFAKPTSKYCGSLINAAVGLPKGSYNCSLHLCSRTGAESVSFRARRFIAKGEGIFTSYGHEFGNSLKEVIWDRIDKIACKTCKRTDREAKLLLCDGWKCGRAYHYDTCLPSPLTKVPKGEWFCGQCSGLRGGGAHVAEISS